ncbi:uncharacterized protein LOC105197698 isoform X2 [Solenopsis invicta]|uniref:uncharacterized protein LOC105197698 isoform X2 n=1 Tax=Solenopsis invicta TaxID=13686 RepID=UPI00193E4615|nr:uncharacterized protein LOC105197698 isoform X2 [Solenopsis invicta]
MSQLTVNIWTIVLLGLRKKRAAPPPPTPRPLSSAISTQTLEHSVDSEELLTSKMGPSKPLSDIGAPSKISVDIDRLKVKSDINIDAQSTRQLDSDEPKAATCESTGDIQQNYVAKENPKAYSKLDSVNSKHVEQMITSVEATPRVEQVRARRVGEPAPLPKPRKINVSKITVLESSKTSKRKIIPPFAPPRILKRNNTNVLLHEDSNSKHVDEAYLSTSIVDDIFSLLDEHDSAKLKPKYTSKHNSIALNEDQISLQKEIPEITSDITAEDNAFLKSNQCLNYQMESNDLQNSTKPIYFNSEEEAHSKSKDFSQEKQKYVQDVINDMENNAPLNLNLYLHNKKHIALNSIELNVSSTKSLLSAYEVSEESRNNSSEQDYKIRSEQIDEIKNQRDNLWTSNNSSLSESVTKLTRMIEPRSEQPKIPHHQFTRKRSSNAQKKTISFSEKSEENVQVVNPETEKETCTVISTIPKCEHLNAIKEDSTSNGIAKREIAEDIDKLCEKRHNYPHKELSSTRNAKRTKVVRSQSKSDDFEMDTLKKQRRYLTLPPSNVAHALNLNLPSQNSTFSGIAEKSQEQVTTQCYTDRTGNADVDKGTSYGELITGYQDIPSETDILLQKVSDTLSNVLPTSSSPVSEPSLILGTNCITASMQMNNVTAVPDVSVIKLESAETKVNEFNELYKLCNNISVENTLSISMPNITVANSQQDTSDYVSAMSEDLSINDWEYQLPAPPSAFRDSHLPTFDNYDTVTLNSMEAFKEFASANPLAELTDVDSNDKNIESTKDLSNNIEVNSEQRISSENKIDLVKRMTSKSFVKQTPIASQKLETDSDLRKEVISELENKIEIGVLAQTVNKDFDRRNMDSLSAPELAPVDNTLSNFTITTYTRQKSLDIFEEFEESSDVIRNSEERFIKTFATLSRNNAGACNYDQSSTMKSTHLINNLSNNRRITNKSEESNTNNADCKMEPICDQDKSSDKWRSFNVINDKTNIQRSKSYILMSNNAKYQKKTQEIDARKHESQMKLEITGMKKATSITDLNVNTRKDNEKFPQWRDNILKNQEKSTKENQLRSLQVLKSILPQLKNTQQAEENVSKDYNNTLSIQKTIYEANCKSHEHTIRMNADSFCESHNLKSECKQLLKEESAKHYVYTGPPAISLGSWLERPSVNVQIKTDTDYKLGKSNMINDSKIININGKKEKDIANYANSICKNGTRHELNVDSLENKNSNELIARTTTSSFKLPDRFNMVSPYLARNEDKPVVMGIELKRTSFKAPRELLRNDKNEVDTTPMNFKELTKTFNQYTDFKQKSKRTDRHLAHHRDTKPNEMEKITNSNVKENDHAWFARTIDKDDFSFKSQVQQISRTKKFTSIIGGMSQKHELQSEKPFRCSNVMKINPPIPVVKGFKISIADSKMNNNQTNNCNGLSTVEDSNRHMQPPKPPTMPVITGVMFKNANTRPKSMPIQLNPRDMLLESIRNFGGHEKLKRTSEGY